MKFSKSEYLPNSQGLDKGRTSQREWIKQRRIRY